VNKNSEQSRLASQPTAVHSQNSRDAGHTAKTASQYPTAIRDENELDDLLTRPSPALTEFVRSLSSPLLILGAGGKMGPTLAVLAKRAAQATGHKLDVIAVSRFSDELSRRWLEEKGVSTVSADLFSRDAVNKLPDAANVIYLVGLKFGTQENPSLTWAANTIVPAHVSERFPKSRLVALSTGNVYPLVPAGGDRAKESHPLTPLGEYANAAVARERIFEYFAQKNGTPVALIRLSYAVELRYGVLVDIARKVHAGESIDLTSGFFNCIWQGDANEMILRSLALTNCPATAINLTGTSVLSVRDVAEQFGKLFDRPAKLVGTEADTALLSNTEHMCQKLGNPKTPMNAVIRWTAGWIKDGGRLLNKSTHFEVRDGKY